MTPQELYENTRGAWKVGARREKAEYAFAVFQGIVREVYKIHQWLPAGTLPYNYVDSSKMKGLGRWEFEGKVADDIRLFYVGKTVREYLSKASQYPIKYVDV